ncbi:MAG TPA: hypothetical protein VGG25_12785 [Streptosporangiaceae bacterium]
MPPFPRIGRLRVGVVVVVAPLQEVSLAQVPVDVVIARHHDHSLRSQAQRLPDLPEERPRLVELGALATLGDVTGDHDEVDGRHTEVAQPAQVTDQVPGQRIVVGETVINARTGCPRRAGSSRQAGHCPAP